MVSQISTNGQSELHHSFPTRAAAANIHDAQDFLHAVEAYRFFYPTVSAEALFSGARDAGIEDGKGMMLLAAGPQHLIFTANSDTPYGCATIDLRATGPLVIEIPAGPYIGLVDDHHQRWILDMGIPGADGGKGGKYLVLPPDAPQVPPAGYHIGRSTTYKILVAVRAMPVDGGQAGALDALRRVKLYPMSNPNAVIPAVDASNRPIDTTPLRREDNLEYWKRLHLVIEAEPAIEEFRPMYGVLAALGLEKGRPFTPDARMQRILVGAARAALEQMRVEGFASERPDRIVWEDRQWEWIGLVPDDPNFETRDYLDLQARDRWFFQAIVASPAMFRRKVGVGSVYFLAARDRQGAYLDGGNNYKLTIPHPVPAKLFWSVTAYDAKTRSQVKTEQNRAVLGSLQDRFVPNVDGTIDVYFGPKPPPGREKQWIQTAPGRGFFLYFRIYGPEAASLDGGWRLGDLTEVTRRADQAPAIPKQILTSISTPDHVESRLGPLSFVDGMPSIETAAKLFDHLDFTHAVQTFMNAFQAVSTFAIRRGLLDVGLRDHDVLLFSGLMDSSSLFLTANCDTVYFITFLDVERGPVVMEVPPNVLGVVDDMWFRWVTDVGVPGPDRGQGGRYLFLPSEYDGPLPEGGYFVSRSRTNRLLVLGRAFLQNDDPAPAVTAIKRGLRIYPYRPGATGSSVASFLQGRGTFARLAPPAPPMKFAEGTGLSINTIPPNDATFFTMLDAAVQAEPADALDEELAGPLAAIGIVKGKRFHPDARMTKILTEAVALGNATSRTLGLRARDEEGFRYYDRTSAWMNPLMPGGYEFLRPPPRVGKTGVELAPNPGARLLNARTQFFYVATGVTPAMAMTMAGIGSQYLGAFTDSQGRPFDGAKYYRVVLPRNIPAAQFWSLTLYDNQTRSMLQTDQRFPRAGSQGYPSPAATPHADGSTAIYFGPARPTGVPEGNWIQTLPGKGWFVALRLYSPLEPFFDKSWRPSEVDEMT